MNSPILRHLIFTLISKSDFGFLKNVGSRPSLKKEVKPGMHYTVVTDDKRKPKETAGT